jgi:hypothetical protein
LPELFGAVVEQVRVHSVDLRFGRKVLGSFFKYFEPTKSNQTLHKNPSLNYGQNTSIEKS